MQHFYGLQLIVWSWFITWIIWYWVDSTYDLDQKLDFDLWPCDPNINREHPLSRGIPYTKFGDFQAKGTKDNKQTMIFFSKTSSLTLTINHVTSKPIGVPIWPLSSKEIKRYWADIFFTSILTLTFDHLTSYMYSIRVIYTLGASTVPSFKQMGQKICLVYMTEDWQVQNNMPSFFKGGQKNSFSHYILWNHFHSW